MAPPTGEGISAFGVDLDGGSLCVREGISPRCFLRKGKEGGAATPAPVISPMEEGPIARANLGGGLISARDWEMFRAQ
uniref:Predicted protein n=1 Tax=Hordeum vulgare subsp. vulgare TaxID=112509 RepID=F2DKB5_HORVV|nr:predicted protein [Hordeum vulgare subsp. vulgare]